MTGRIAGLWITPTCDDGEACNGVETCYAGGCVAGAPLDCEDGVACTLDSCEPAEGCVHTPVDAACDDGVACTVDQCDPVTGCSSTPSAALCDDGVACTRDLCDAALGCVHQPLAAACDDGVSCTTNSCDLALGCVTSPVDAACDDGNPCTTDVCTAGGCVHTDDGSCASQCGDGVCAPSEETCVTCPGDCGVCPEGDCCARRADAGCGEPAVEACVCAADAYCCDVLWDDVCAARVTELDCGTCQNATVCGDAACDPSEDCASCAADCGACVAACGDEMCQVSEDCATCPEDCGACPNTCCTAHETAGCDAADVESCVCVADDYCCVEAWDAACANAVEMLGCGSCVGAGVCGDGVCDVHESCASCTLDCGECPPVCGDGACEPGETCLGCAADCGVCPPPEPCLAALGVSCDDFEQAYVKASSTDAGDYFGYAVAIDGDWIVVGAPRDDGPQNNLADAGAAYVFRRVSGIWQQAAYLVASNADPNDQFGYAVAISGTRIVVGAPYEDSAGSDPSDNSASMAGAAYVFDWSGKVWKQRAMLKALNAETGDRFGMTVAVSGDLVAVGAPYEDSDGTSPFDNSRSSAGAVYVFARDRFGGWFQDAMLKASNVDANDRFGSALALAGGHLAVGAPHESSRAVADGGWPGDNAAPSAGAVYVFELGTGGWSAPVLLKAHNAEAGDRFGSALAMSDGVLAVGAPYESSASAFDPHDNKAAGSGAVYVFAVSASDWALERYVKASTVDPGDRFGQSLGLDGATLVVGIPYEAGDSRGIGGDPARNGASRAGAVELFERVAIPLPTPGFVYVWNSRALIKSSNPDPYDYFGAAVDVADGTLVAGAYGEDSAASGIDGDQSDNTKSTSGAVYIRRVAP